MKPKHYYCELYKMNFYFFIGWSEYEFQKWFSRKFNYIPDCNTSDGVTLTLEHGSKPTIIAIWTRYKTKYPIIAHECIHAAKETLEMRGINISDSNGETLAYYVEMLMNKCSNSH